MTRRAFIYGGMAAILASRRAPAFCIAMRNGMTRPSGAPTPPLPYDAEVEYLQSTGTQYIDTGVAARRNLLVTCRFVFRDLQPVANVYTAVLGARRSRTWFILSERGNNATVVKSELWVGAASAYGRYEPTVYLDDTSWHTVSICTTEGSGKAYVEVEGFSSINSKTASSSFDGVAINLYAFAINNGSGAEQHSKCSISGLSIYDTTTNVSLADFMPVRFTNELGQSEGAMYDRVGGQLFRNAGTGAFQYGNDVS